MSFLSRHPRVRWAGPVAAAALVVGGVATAQSSAGDQSDLAPRSAHDLLVDLQKARPTPLSGTVVQTTDLGLPDLSALGGAGPAGGTNPLALLTGSHTWRVWYADPQHARLALVDGTTETDVVRNGSDLWQWSSTDGSVTHATVPGEAASSPDDVTPTAPAPGGSAVPGLPDLSDPDRLATWALARLDPSTEVTSTTTDTVAGRPAYGLVLTPRTPATRIGSVRLSVDAETSLPLAVTVVPRGSGVPAVDVRFTRLTLGAPDASVFDFTPPPGATVRTPGEESLPEAGPGHGSGSGVRPALVGTGWATVVVGQVPTPPAGSKDHAPDPLTAVEKALPQVSGAWGSGRLFTTRLFTAVLTDDGRFAAGAVDPSALYSALEH